MFRRKKEEKENAVVDIVQQCFVTYRNQCNSFIIRHSNITSNTITMQYCERRLPYYYFVFTHDIKERNELKQKNEKGKELSTDRYDVRRGRDSGKKKIVEHAFVCGRFVKGDKQV